MYIYIYIYIYICIYYLVIFKFTFLFTFLYDCYIDITKCFNIFQYFILKELLNFCHQNFITFFICKTYSINNYEMTNVFNMLDHLLTNINHAAKQT